MERQLVRRTVAEVGHHVPIPPGRDGRGQEIHGLRVRLTTEADRPSAGAADSHAALNGDRWPLKEKAATVKRERTG